MGMATFINLRRLQAIEAANRQRGDEQAKSPESARMEPESASKPKPARPKGKKVAD